MCISLGRSVRWKREGLRGGFDSRQCTISLFSTVSRSVLGAIHPPIQWVPQGFFPRGTGGGGGKVALTLRTPQTPNVRSGQESVDLYIHFPIRLHGAVLNWLRKETNLPFQF
jgi:hypothetical protein